MTAALAFTVFAYTRWAIHKSSRLVFPSKET